MKYAIGSIAICIVILSGCSANNSNNANVNAKVPGTATPSRQATSVGNTNIANVTMGSDDTSNDKPFVGTTDKTEVKKQTTDQATLIRIRSAAHADHDRIVFEFKEAVPGYLIEYVDGNMQACGSGDDVAVDGNAKMRVRFVPAKAHTDEGQPTLPYDEFRSGLKQIIEVKRTCDFEAEVEWAIGSNAKKPYRVTELRDPSRIVIDVKH